MRSCVLLAWVCGYTCGLHLMGEAWHVHGGHHLLDLVLTSQPCMCERAWQERSYNAIVAWVFLLQPEDMQALLRGLQAHTTTLLSWAVVGGDCVLPTSLWPVARGRGGKGRGAAVAAAG